MSTLNKFIRYKGWPIRLYMSKELYYTDKVCTDVLRGGDLVCYQP